MQFITYMLISRLTCIIVTKFRYLLLYYSKSNKKYFFAPKNKIISLPTYPHLADRVGIGETNHILFLA